MTVVRTRDNSPETTAPLDNMLAFDDTPWERLWTIVDNLEQQREQLAWRIRTFPHVPRAGLDTSGIRPEQMIAAWDADGSPLCDFD